ncbi:serine hydrolase [Ulvibacterium sp.]|uniref:serine hydrolase n=1 Tax=Ulvibacterium sp. TaxID=2665914 RepID=UPI00263A313C|nr:serine hydrolase [Ulvibacterium sp.]
MENNTLAKNLIYQRKLKGYSQEDLSEKTNVAVRTIQRIEKGNTKPHLQTIKLLAAALEIKVEDLLVLENPKIENLQKKWLLLLHGTPILGLVLPLCNVLFPLFLWIHKREDNPIYDAHGRRVINFQITMTILFLLSFIALITVEGLGFFLFMGVIPYTLIVTILNIVTVLNAKKCYYPLAFPFLKKGMHESSKTIGLLLTFFIFGLIGCNSKSSQNISQLPGTTITRDSLTAKIEQLTTDAQVHGLAVSIFNGNTATYQKTFGYRDYKTKMPLTDSTNMYGASLSKAVFAVLTMKLVEEGIIDLDTPLESYLPKKIYEYEPMTRWHDDFSDLAADTLYPKITARMCLAHTTGFPNWRWFEEDRKLRVKFEPGSRYQYSGEGMVYLQVILEKILSKDLESLAQEYIFKPIGMENSGYQWYTRFEKDFAYGHSTKGQLYPKDTDNEPRGPSTLETTARDYTRFLEAVLQEKLISKSSWAALFRPQIRIRSTKQFGPLSKKDTTLYDAINLSYGLGWGLFETPYGFGAFKEGHGDGFQHYSVIFPQTGKGILIMANSDNGESIFKELLEVAIGDTYTPWEWENYIPYNQ